MALSIQFDSTQIHDSTHVPQFIKHETIADRIVTSLVQARDDGELVVSEVWGKKIIALQGTLIGSSQADLESKIDTFNELMSRQEKNLDIDWNGSTRRYVASCTKLTYNRDHYNISAVPWTAEFTIFSGEGKDTSATVALNAHSLTVTTPAADSFTMNGSKPAKPTITLQGNNWPGGALGVEYKNTDTGEKLVVTRAAGLGGSTDSIIMDFLLKKVTGNIGSSLFTPYTFFGIFPKFKIGTNNVKVSVGDLSNQMSTDFATLNVSPGPADQPVWDTIEVAQSFIVPYTDSTFQSVWLKIYKNGSPATTVTLRIETDANGIPSDTTASGLSMSFSSAAISGTRGWVKFSFGSPGTLQANTKYWIVLKDNAADASNNVSWGMDTIGDYPNGKAMLKINVLGVPTWSDETAGATQGIGNIYGFSLNYGGVGSLGSVKHTVSYFPTYL